MNVYISNLSIEPVYEELVSNRWAIDVHWRFIDAAGHKHSYTTMRSTLTEMVDRSEWCDGECGAGEPHEVILESHWVCRECGERIEPGRVHPGTVQQLFREWRGLVGALVDNYGIEMPLTHDECVEIVNGPARERVAAVIVERIIEPLVTPTGIKMNVDTDRPIRVEWMS